MFDFLKPTLNSVPNIKFSYNIGALLDIPTGSYERGIYNESLLNGGLGSITGIVGIGNSFKSTIMHYMMLTAMSRFKNSSSSTYDTEVNVSENRLKRLYNNIREFNGEDIIDNGRWLITDKTVYHGNEWFEKFKEYTDMKIKRAKEITFYSPFVSRDGITPLKMLIPTFTEIDSLTKFTTENSSSMQEDNEIGDSNTNTIYMKEGQAKKQLLNSLPRPVQQSNHYVLISSHIGKSITIDPKAVPVKKLSLLKNNDVLKGVTDDFTYLTTNLWNCINTTLLINDSTKGPEYPREGDTNLKGDVDLSLVTMLSLRSKTGKSGILLQLIVSQEDGVLPSLTEFHYIKNNERYGLDGTLQNYSLDLLPDVKLSRTTVRTKLEENDNLRRAMNITAEMCQMKYIWSNLDEKFLITPKELYEKLKSKGYSWEETLLKTRGYWTIDNDKQEVPYLSTMDLIRMALPEDDKDYYFPYWLENDKKTIKYSKK